MPNLYERWAAVFKGIVSTPAIRVRSIAIPWERVLDNNGARRDRFEAGQHYFSVVINELFLANSREWWTVYDPMAVVVSEFTYDGKRAIVPFVVGPLMLKDKVQQVPNGMTITDTRVAGIHPFVGGSLAFTIILARVKRESYANRLLTFVESVSGAFPVGAALRPHLKVAGAIMDGVESLFGMTETTPLIGHRFEFNDGTTPWLEPGFFALINEDERKLDRDGLGVVKGRLRKGWSDSASPFSEKDYLLYSLCCLPKRDDYSELPFHQAFLAALQNAGSLGNEAWERAKANLVTLFQALLVSPDLTWDQAQEIVDLYKAKLIAVHKKVESFGELSDGGTIESESRRQRLLATGLFDRVPVAERNQRAFALQAIHNLLNL